MFTLSVKAPTRIDLAGGTLDLWPLYCLLEQKMTVNCAIDLNTQVSVKESSSKKFSLLSEDQKLSWQGSFAQLAQAKDLELFSYMLEELWDQKLPALDISANAGSPKGAGLGGSSTLVVCLATALLEARSHYLKETLPDERQVVRICQDIEARLLRMPTGSQDYWAAVRGGCNLISYPAGEQSVETLDLDFFDESDFYFLLISSGQSRFSGMNNWDVYKKLIDGDKTVRHGLEAIGRSASLCGQALRKKNFSEALSLSKEEWAYRKELWPAIETKKTQEISSFLEKSGVFLTRVCGAGGGGAMASFIHKEHISRLKSQLKNSKINLLTANLSCEGLAKRLDS